MCFIYTDYNDKQYPACQLVISSFQPSAWRGDSSVSKEPWLRAGLAFSETGGRGQEEAPTHGRHWLCWAILFQGREQAHNWKHSGKASTMDSMLACFPTTRALLRDRIKCCMFFSLQCKSIFQKGGTSISEWQLKITKYSLSVRLTCSLREIIKEGVWRLSGPTWRTSWGPPSLTLIRRKQTVCSWLLMEALCETECPSKNTWFLTAESYPLWDLLQPNTTASFILV